MSLVNANEDVASTDRGYSGLLDSDETVAYEVEDLWGNAHNSILIEEEENATGSLHVHQNDRRDSLSLPPPPSSVVVDNSRDEESMAFRFTRDNSPQRVQQHGETSSSVQQNWHNVVNFDEPDLFNIDGSRASIGLLPFPPLPVGERGPHRFVAQNDPLPLIIPLPPPYSNAGVFVSDNELVPPNEPILVSDTDSSVLSEDENSLPSPPSGENAELQPQDRPIEEEPPLLDPPAEEVLPLPDVPTNSRIVTPPRALPSQSDFSENVIRRGGYGRQKKRAKRKFSSSPESDSNKKVVAANNEDDDDDALSCPICFESWTNSGSHRLTSLRCGHIFGHKCIERWLKDCFPKCPQCNAKAKRNDMRVIYAKKLVALDTADLERALKEAERERNARRQCEMELATTRLQYHMAVDERERLKIQLSSLQVQLEKLKENSYNLSSSQSTSSSCSSLNMFYHLMKTNVIAPAGGCRVMDFHSKTQQFVVSQPSPHATFMSGFGVKRISASEMRGGHFTMLHPKPIKDLQFNQHIDHHLLSASQDGSLRITDLMSNAKIHEYKVGKPVWSCCWDSKDRNVIYAGLSNGSLEQFDLRHTSHALSRIENLTSSCPIVSLYHLPPTATNRFQSRGGLLTGTLEGAMFWHDSSSADQHNPSLISEFKPSLLPLSPGSCTGLQYCPRADCFLATFRPGRSYTCTTHLLCNLICQNVNDNPQVSCNVLETYTGGQVHKMLTRNALFAPPRSVGAPRNFDILLSCVGDEARNKVHIYESSGSKLIQSLDSDGGPPLDIIPVQVDGSYSMLAVLSQSTLKLFQLS